MMIKGRRVTSKEGREGKDGLVPTSRTQKTSFASTEPRTQIEEEWNERMEKEGSDQRKA